MWQEIVKMDVKETGREDVDWINSDDNRSEGLAAKVE
jgi:hypothetical protein